MKSFEERSPLLIGMIGVGLTLTVALTALNYDKLPFVDQTRDYSAHFAEAGGLVPGTDVQVSGMRVGQVQSIGLDGPRVLVKFNVDKSVPVGDRSEAAIKTRTILGAKYVELSPRGDGDQTGPIPIDRTESAYQLPGRPCRSVADHQRAQHQRVVAVAGCSVEHLQRHPTGVEGGAAREFRRFSDTLNRRDEHLRGLLENANKATAVLAERSDQVVSLVTDTNALLASLQQESTALDQIATNISAFARELKGFISENRDTLKPAVDKLNGVLTIVDNRKERVQKAVKQLNAYLMSLGESASSGPFFKAYISNLLTRTVPAAFHRCGVLRPRLGSQCPAAVGPHRPAGGPAGHAGATRAVSADRPGR